MNPRNALRRSLQRLAALLPALRPWFCLGGAGDAAHRALNVNFPAVDVATIQGVRATEPAPHADFGVNFERNDDGAYKAVWVDKTPPAAQADTDIAWLALGYITVTPLDANYASSSPEVAKLRSLIDGQTAAR